MEVEQALKAALEEWTDTQGQDQSQVRDQRKKVDKRLRELWPKLEALLPPVAATEDAGAPAAPASGGTGLHELVVLFGECAAKVRSTDLAVGSVNTLLRRLPPLGRVGLQCRLLCVAAWAKASLGAHLRAAEAVNQRLKAAAYILQALEIAVLPEVKAASPQLVYNISVCYWNIIRPLLREGASRYLVGSMGKVVDALEASNDTDRRWRIQYLSTLAMALDDANQTPQAAARVNLAAQYAKEVLEGEKAKAAADSTALGMIHKDIEAIRIKLRQLDKALEAAFNRSESQLATEEERAAALAQIPLLREEARGVREGQLANMEAQLRDAETRLEASVKVQREASAVCDGLLVQRLYSGRRGDGDGKKLVDAAKQDVTKDGSLRLKTLFVVQGIKAGTISGTDVEKELTALFTQVKGALATPEGVEAMADAGLCAARLGHNSLALDALDLVSKAKTQAPVVRVKLDYLKCQLMCAEAWLPDKGPLAKSSERMDERHRHALSLARRAEAVRLLERALIACKRLDFCLPLLHDGAILAWNLALPLLDPHLKRQVHRLLTLAAVELERVDSPLMQLRALLHTELAKLELSSDLLASAATEVNKALRFDYCEFGPPPAAESKKEAKNAPPPPPDPIVSNPPADLSPAWCEPPVARQLSAQEEAENERLRPLDKFLLPLQLKLGLKASIYQASEDRADKALVLLEQAREAKDPQVRLRLLDRAAMLLKTMDKSTIALLTSSATDHPGQPQQEPESFVPDIVKKFTAADADGSGPADETPLPRRKRLASLWALLAELAWEVRDIDLLHDSVLRLLDDTWHPQRQREALVSQARAQFMLAESFVELLLDEGTDLEPICPDADYDPLLLGVTFPDLDPRQMELKRAVATTLLAGIRRAARSGEVWLVENGCVYLWNYHLPALKKRLYGPLLPELLAALETALASLRELRSQDSLLMSAMAEALVLAYEGRGEASKVIELSTAYVPLARPYQARGMVMALARVSLGKAPVPGAVPAKERDKKGGGGGATGHPDVRLLDAVSLLTVAGLTGLGEKERDDALAKAATVMEEDRKAAASRSPATTMEDFDEGLELRAELWCRLGHEFLRRKANRRVQACCDACLALLPSNNPADLNAALKPRLLRWLSVAQCLWGRSVAGMVDTQNQDKALQDTLRVNAMTHLVEAAGHGAKAGLGGLVIEAARHLWAVSGPMQDTPVSRCDLFAPLLGLLTHLNATPGQAAPSLRARLYALSFQCYADERRWAEGQRAVTEAFEHVPPSQSKPLWQWKVVFMSKLGKSVLDGIAKMKEADPVLQARVWAALAKSATSVRQQMEAYMRILSLLHDRFERTEYYVEAAEWLLSRHMGRRKPLVLLQAAVDAILDVEVGEGEEELLDESRSQASRSQGGSSSKLSSRVGGKAETNRTSRTARSRGPGSVRSRRSGKGPGSTRSAARSPRSNASRSQRGSSRGTTLNADGSPMALGAGHYDLLLRCLIMIAQLGQSAAERRDRCVQAVGYAGGLVTALLHALNTALRMDAHAKLSKEDQLITPLDAVAVDASKLLPVPTSPTSLCLLPLTPALLDAARRLASDRRLRHHAFSPRNFSRLPVTLHHLSWLVDSLCAYDLHLHAGVCMTLAHLLSELAPSAPTPFLPLLTRTRRARLLTSLGRNAAAKAILQAPSPVPLGLDNRLAEQYLGDVEERERQLSARREAGRGPPPRSEDDDLLLKGFDTRKLWGQLAEEAMLLGQARPALEYLNAAARHNEAYEDERNASACARVRALLMAAQGKDREAAELLLEGVRKQGASGGPGDWARAACLLAEWLAKNGEDAEAERVVSKACTALLARVTPPSTLGAGLSSGSHHLSSRSQAQNSSSGGTGGPQDTAATVEEVDMDAALAWAQCATCLASLLAQKTLKQVRKSRSLAAASGLSDPFGRFESVERRLSGWVGLHPYAADVVLTHARSALEAHRTLAWLQGQPVSTQDLQNVRALYARGVRLLMEVQATALPPRPLRSEALQQLPVVSLPVTRRLAEAQAELASLDGLLARALREHTSVAAAALERQAIANPAQRFLAETEPTPPPTLQTLGVRYCEEAIALGASALALSAAHPPLAAAAAAAMGAGHLIVGLASGKLDRAWDVTPSNGMFMRAASALNVNAAAAQNSLGNKTPAGGGKGSNKDAPPPPPPPAPPLPPTEPLACSEQGLCVAVEEGVRAENWEAVGRASAALVQVYAASRCREAVASLMLYQSCSIRPFLLQTFLSAASDTDRQAIFIRQALRQLNPTSLNLPACQVAIPFLRDQCMAWRRLDCSAKPLEVLDKLPQSLWVLSLQLGPEQAWIYAGGQGGGNSAIARSPLGENERSELLELQRRMASLRKDMAKHMLLYGDEAGVYGDLEAPGGEEASKPSPAPKANNKPDANPAPVVRRNSVEGRSLFPAIPTYADPLEAELRGLLTRTEALLRPLLSHPSIAAFLSACAAVPKASLMLLLDQELLPLPIEGLAPIRAVPSVSRDFSLHILNHRLGLAKEVNAGKEVLEVKGADMSFIADPRVEDTGSASKLFPRATVTQTMEELRKTVGTAWKGVMGKDRTPAPWEWQAGVGKRGGGGFLFYGPGRTLAHFPPSLLAGLSAKGCQWCVLVDQVDNDPSFRRQSKLDTAKTTRELQVEQPVETAVLLTLAGVNAITTNQWASSFAANARFVTRLFDTLIKQQQQLGDSVRIAATAPVIVPKRDMQPRASLGGQRSTLRRASKTGEKSEMLTLTVKTRVACNAVTYGLPSFVLT